MLNFYTVDWADVVRQSMVTLKRCLEQAEQTKAARALAEGPGFVYHGSHDPLPRGLLQDRRLTPVERNLWLVLRWLITERQMRTPRYQDLQPYLATSPCGAQASRETIARALNVLRATRWLTLSERYRDEQGCLRGCVYVLHDAPLSPAQAIDQDAGYLALISQNLSHATKGVRDLAQHLLQELRADPEVAVETLAMMASPPATGAQQALPLQADSHAEHSERGKAHSVRSAAAFSADSEPSVNVPVPAAVRNPAQGRTVQKQSKKSTVPPASASGSAAWPEGLQLSPTEQRRAVQALRQLAPEQRQAVINEAAVRCSRGDIRKPIAYLLGLIKRACQGDFTLWAARSDAPPAPRKRIRPPEPADERSRESGSRVASPLAKAYLEQLKLRCGVVNGAT
ncbi:STY4528 family pathogenicity island replication protein [Pseudomonas asiatica]|uniref:STY4528 family pathogenicity island replication protein n=1 Tax=Pseudomonas asiatica TaxID=2219225 RepID=UPI002570EDD0|nr:STY4528 family pathogenicity island replication protein [Pseudomonas asiatica]WJD72181.1 STY4528 family pathogenicity island replication protein [Pseudomonas asiatica]